MMATKRDNLIRNLVYIALWVLIVARPQSVNTDCVGGKKHGDVFKIGPCFTCSCLETKLSCTNDCQGDNLKEPLESKVHLPKFPVIAKPLKETFYILTEEANHDCLHESIYRKHDEKWRETSPHSSNLGDRECMQCHCHKQIVTCTIRFCPKLTCGNPTKQDGTCCLKCPDLKSVSEDQACFQSGSVFEAHSTWLMYVPVPDSHGHCLDCHCIWNGGAKPTHACIKKKCPARRSCKYPVGKPGQCCEECEDCKFGRNSYKNRKYFIPSIDECLRCECQGSFIQCSRVICNEPYSCLNPRLRPGLCCPTCSDVSHETAQRLEERTLVKIAKHRYTATCYKHEANDIVHVYVSATENKNETLIQSFYIFDHSNKKQNKKLEMHSWIINGNNISVTVTSLTTIRIQSSMWIYLGTIRKKTLKRIRRHEDEMRSLIGQSLCNQKIKDVRKLIVEKSSKKRVCKLLYTKKKPRSIQDILNTLQEER